MSGEAIHERWRHGAPDNWWKISESLIPISGTKTGPTRQFNLMFLH